MLYTSKEVVTERLWLRISESESLSLIQRATDIIDSELGENLWEKTLEERTSGTGKNKLYLKYIPKDIISIEGPSWNMLHDFFEGYIIYTDYCTQKWEKNYKVTYKIGFTVVPKDIEEICLALIAWICFQEWKSNNKIKWYIQENISSKKIDSLAITYETGAGKVKNTMDLIAPHLNVQKVFQKYKAFTWLHDSLWAS